MNMHAFILGLIAILGLMTNPISAKNPELTIWIRAGGPAVKAEISNFILQILDVLPHNVPSQVLVCTNEDDTILEELDSITQKHERVKVVFSKLSSFSSALTNLAQNTPPESNVLTLSVGVHIRQDQIETGLENLIDGVKVYGWAVRDHGNDGSCPGKGWYNTAALLDKTIVQQMKEGVPKWVDNGFLGTVGKYVIGGNEEIPIMIEALQRDLKPKFILNVPDPVSSSLQLGTGITFQEKIERKIVVAKYYMQKLHQEYGVIADLESWETEMWEALEVI